MIIKLQSTLLENIINKFQDENGYFVWDEVPGWLRAHGYNVKMLTDDELFYIEFEQDTEYSKFLLEWA